MLGLLVSGDNHFIVRGPKPSPTEAQALIRRWSLIEIGSGIDPTLPSEDPWRVSTREFRENLEWAIVVQSPFVEREHSSAVRQLLDDLSARGIAIHHTPGDQW